MKEQDSEKSKEAIIRRKLKKLGCTLKKSRVKNITVDNLGGYMVVHSATNKVDSGGRFDLSLEDIEMIYFDLSKNTE